MKDKTNEELKAEAIAKAYGEHWDLVKPYVDQNGWIKSREFSYYQNINGMSEIPIINIFSGKDSQFIQTKSGDYIGDQMFENIWRPVSLQGIDTNNGWIRLEPIENNLPNKFDCDYEVFPRVNNDRFLNLHQVIHYAHHQMITHYKEVPNSKNPIF